MNKEHHINRRDLLYKSAISGSMIAIAGCSSNNGGSSNDGGSSDENPLDVSGFVTADESTGDFVTQIEATNSSDQSVTADFSAVWELDDNKGEITSGTEETTIPADSSQEFQLSMVNADNINPDEFIAIYYLGFQVEILVNENVQPEVCPDTDISNPNQQGCQYPFGVEETHVEVEYSGSWSGAAGSEGNTRTIDKGSSVVSETSDTAYVSVSDDASIISANAQKRDNGSDTLTIRIVHRDEIVAEQSTSAEYGVAQVNTRI